MDKFLSMQQECLQLKTQHLADQKVLRELTARLARTEEAAKHVIMLRDPTARGPAAARLLDAERALALAEAERAEMQARAGLAGVLGEQWLVLNSCSCRPLWRAPG